MQAPHAPGPDSLASFSRFLRKRSVMLDCCTLHLLRILSCIQCIPCAFVGYESITSHILPKKRLEGTVNRCWKLRWGMLMSLFECECVSKSAAGEEVSTCDAMCAGDKPAGLLAI